MEEMQRARGTEQLGSSLTCSWVVMVAPSHGHAWWTPWPLGTGSSPSASPLPPDQGVGLKVPALYSLVFWAIRHSPHIFSAFKKSPCEHKPSCGGKEFVMNKKTPISPLWTSVTNWGQETKYNKKCSYCSYLIWDSKGFESWGPENRRMTSRKQLKW